MESFALEILNARDSRQCRCRQKAQATKEESRRVFLAASVDKQPRAVFVIPMGSLDLSLELDVLVHVVLLRNALNVFVRLRLRGESLLPVPLVQEFSVERESV